MTRTELLDRLHALAEPDYRAFSQKLLPHTENILGVRLPLLHALAKEIIRKDPAAFLFVPCGEYFEEQMDPQEAGEVTIWVRPDNRDAVFSNSVEVNESAYQYLGIGFAAGLIGLLLMFIRNAGQTMSRQQQEEHLEDTKLYSGLVFIVCIIGIIIQLTMSYADYKNGEYVNPVMYDFSIACGIIAVICTMLFIRAKKKLKKFGY